MISINHKMIINRIKEEIELGINLMETMILMIESTKDSEIFIIGITFLEINGI